jgi:hypothetical protein
MKALVALSIAVLVAACASEPAYSPERYLQIRSQTPTAVLAQITLLNGPECWKILDRIRYEVGTRVFPGASAACLPTTAESELPFRATLRNRPLQVILEVATDSRERCEDAIAIARKGQASPDDIDVISPCGQIASR